MADKSGVLDNSWQSTQRLINSSFNTQTFSNTTGDSSYSLDPNDTNDYFHLKLTQRSSLILTLTNLTGNADLSLLDNSGIAMQTSSNGGVLAEAITTSSPLDPGDYYIQVSDADPSATVSQYTLNVSTIPTSRTDIVWRNYSSGQNLVWQMNGSSVGSKVFTNSVSDSNWKLQAAGDMDGDGASDYVWRNSSTGQDVVWLMNGTNHRSTVYIKSVSDSNWNIEGASDFNGDGSTDLVWRNNSTGQNIIWLMNGLTFSSSINLQSLPSTYQIGAVADFNGDSKPDIVWRNYDGSGQNLIWIMNGLNYSYSTSLRVVTGNWNIIGAGDFNGDSNSDLVWQSIDSNGSQNLIWYMNQTSSVSSAYVSSVSDPNWKMATTVISTPIVDFAGSTISNAFNIGTLNDSGIYSDTVGGPSDSIDYYKFTAGGSIVLNLSLTGLSANADVWLINDANNNGIVDNTSEIIASSVNLGTTNEQISNLNLTAGTYFIRVFTPDSSQRTAYSLNVGSVPAQQVDLLPIQSAFTVTQTNGSALPTQVSLDSTKSGYLSTVKVNYQIKNSSISYTPSQFRVSFYLSRDNIITTSDRKFGTIDSSGNSDADIVINNLTFGSTISGSQLLTMPIQNDQWWGGDQTYYIGMIVDSTNQVAESNESNNAASAPIGIKYTLTPDIVGNGLSVVQSSASPGQAIEVTGSIKNIGNVATGSTGQRFYVKFYFSNDPVLDGSDQPFTGLASFAPLAAGTSVSFDTNVQGGQTSAVYFPTSPFVLPDSSWSGWRGNGRYYVAMQLNVLNFVPESSGGQENDSNYGQAIGQYLDYNYIDITNAPNNS